MVVEYKIFDTAIQVRQIKINPKIMFIDETLLHPALALRIPSR